MGFRCALLAGLLLFAANGFSGDISEEPFFKFLIGTWTGNGDLVNKDGEKTPIEEEWTAVFGQGGDFTMKGNRQWGDDKQEFRWEFSFNPTSELYECLYWHSGMEEKLRFEASLTEEQVELRSPIGEPGGQLVIVNKKEGETIVGKVTMTDGSEIELLTIEMVHKRKE